MKNSRKQHISNCVMKQHRKTIEWNKKWLFPLPSVLKFEEKKNKLKADWRAREACENSGGGLMGISRAFEVDGTSFLHNFYIHFQTKSFYSSPLSPSPCETFQDPPLCPRMPETMFNTKPYRYYVFFLNVHNKL